MRISVFLRSIATPIVFCSLAFGCNSGADGVAICEAGYGMASAGQLSEAVTALNRCLDSSDLTASVKRRSYDARAWAHSNQANPQTAIAAFSRGIPVQPDYAFVYYRRGVSLEALGKKDLARAGFERVSQFIKTIDVEKVAGRVLPKIRQQHEEYGLK